MGDVVGHIESQGDGEREGLRRARGRMQIIGNSEDKEGDVRNYGDGRIMGGSL